MSSYNPLWVHVYCDPKWVKTGEVDKARAYLKRLCTHGKLVDERYGTFRGKRKYKFVFEASSIYAAYSIRDTFRDNKKYTTAYPWERHKIMVAKLIIDQNARKPKALWTDEEKKERAKQRRWNKTQLEDLIVLGQPYVEHRQQTNGEHYPPSIFIVHTKEPGGKWYQLLEIKVYSGWHEFQQRRWQRGRLKKRCLQWKKNDLSFLTTRGSPSEFIKKTIESEKNWWKRAYQAFITRQEQEMK